MRTPMAGWSSPYDEAQGYYESRERPAERTLQRATSSGTRLGLRQICQHLLGVAVGIDVLPHVADGAIWQDVKRRAGDAHHRSARHVPLHPDAVALRYLRAHIGEQREGQLLPLRERDM